MIEINVPQCELWNAQSQRFVVTAPTVLKLEHSLVSISKWEAKWKKPFLTTKVKTNEEMLDYIKCMSIGQPADDIVYCCIPPSEMERIGDYIAADLTATTFSEEPTKGHSEIVTSELIYYWMVSFNIPAEYQKWHLSRLLTLIRVCSVKNQPPKKMSKRDIMNRNRKLNDARRKALKSKG